MARKRLTSHQAEVLGRVSRLARRGRPVRADEVGSTGALAHLVDKGYLIVADELVGPRGGVTPTYLPKEDA